MEVPHLIDWSSSQNEILLNPRLPPDEKASFMNALEGVCDLKGHIWLTTSGSSGQLKWVALSKEAVLVSAESVNRHLSSNSFDVWLNPLPQFHVGGLGIWARAFLSGAHVVRYVSENARWDPIQFTAQLNAVQATLTSLVPTQVYDMVLHKIRSPICLRAVIVGGGALSERLYLDALNLGWKLLPSYGLSECASQVATAELESWENEKMPMLRPLSHVELELNAQGLLRIRSLALLSLYVLLNKQGSTVVDPKVNGWFTTEDRGIFENGMIVQISRGENFVKIGGESVDLLRLEKILDECKISVGSVFDSAMIALPDARLGHAVHLAIAGDDAECAQDLIAAFEKRVLPFERIKRVHCVTEIPRSPLKKVLKEKLEGLLS